METINLMSDTQTLPTEEMYEAMRTAPLGDDVFGTDPTVNRLQEMSAERLGKERALFVASGTMGNLVSFMAVGQPGCHRAVRTVTWQPRAASSSARLAITHGGPPTRGQNRRVTITSRIPLTAKVPQANRFTRAPILRPNPPGW